jgi:hypothetical protein
MNEELGSDEATWMNVRMETRVKRRWTPSTNEYLWRSSIRKNWIWMLFHILFNERWYSMMKREERNTKDFVLHRKNVFCQWQQGMKEDNNKEGRMRGRHVLSLWNEYESEYSMWQSLLDQPCFLNLHTIEFSLFIYDSYTSIIASENRKHRVDIDSRLLGNKRL